MSSLDIPPVIGMERVCSFVITLLDNSFFLRYNISAYDNNQARRRISRHQGKALYLFRVFFSTLKFFFIDFIVKFVANYFFVCYNKFNFGVSGVRRSY